MDVDQPNTIGALPIAVARDSGCSVAYLPGLAMRKAANLYPGRSKTNARDAFIIADTARAMPRTLRQVDRDSEVLSGLKVLAGFDEDLAHETTRAEPDLIIASNHDPISKAYCERKRAEGKRHNVAVICLARRCCNAIFAMLRNGSYYQSPTNSTAPKPAALPI